jgi:hypothetical protein
MARQTELLN